MKKKDKLFKWANILTLLLIIASVYCLIFLNNFINDNNITWNSTTYQVITQIGVVILFEVVLSVAIYYLYHLTVNKNNQTIDNLRNELSGKNKSIDYLNEKLTKNKLYDFSLKVWSIDIFDTYIKKMYEKNIGKFSLAYLTCKDETAEKEFLIGMKMLDDHRTMLFKKKNLEYIALVISLDKEELDKNISMIKTDGVTILNEKAYDTNIDDMNKVMEENHE